MIKVDPYLLNDTEKRAVLGLGLLSIFITIYTLIIIGISKLLEKLGVVRKWIIIGHLFAVLACFIWIINTDYTLIDFLKPYLQYLEYILLIDPVRLIIAFAYSLFFMFFGHRVREGMEDWVVEEEKKKRKKLLPQGNIDYEDRSHGLLFGATRTGKGVFIDHIILNRILKHINELFVMVSAKLASGDKYSQLEYLRKVAAKAGRKLYVISMDDRVSDRCQYNPFKYLSKDEMRNALTSMLEFDSHYYSKNFTQWVMSIYKIIKAGHDTVSIENILKLYSWDDYYDYASQLYDSGIITKDFFDKMTSERKKDYSEIAKNDAANLEDIVDACSSVFETTPNGKLISITDAFNENALIYFDLNGTSAADSVKMLGGACIMAELQHCMVVFSDPDVRKTVVFDEASYYLNEHLVKAFFNVSASMGYQYIISTQGPSDIMSNTDHLKHQLNNNLGQLATLRVSDPDDVEMIDGIIGCTLTSENTHRAMSIDYDYTGSIKAKNQEHVPHDVIKNLMPLNVIYYQKCKSVDDEAKPVRVVLSTDDL